MSLEPVLRFTVPHHCVPRGPDGLSPLQSALLHDPSLIRIGSAPTGAGKTYAFIRSVIDEKAKVLFVVPTRRLAQNQVEALRNDLISQGIDPEDAEAYVSIWTSDETKKRKAADEAYDAYDARVRDVDSLSHLRHGKFIVATPESVAFLIINGRMKPGETRFGLYALMAFDHVVFDEFHSIEARGFGLAAAFARLSCTYRENVPKVTFLSATPIEIRHVLTSLDIPKDDICVLREEIISTDETGSDSMRALHGDVEFVFVETENGLITDALDATLSASRACLKSKRQIVMIFDSVQDLFRAKEKVAAFAETLGIPVNRRLAINSWDDTERSSLERHFSIGRDHNPLEFDLILATASIEMGVTLKAGLLIMNPGHSSASFIQRAGRVARGDEPGRVVVVMSTNKKRREPWLYTSIEHLKKHGSSIDVETMVSCFMSQVASSFEEGPNFEATLEEQDFKTFGRLSKRAVWISALFWVAHASAWHLTQKQKASILDTGPQKARFVGALLARIRSPRKRTEGNDPFEVWKQSFVSEALRLRNIGASVTIVTSDGNTRSIPWKVYAAFDSFRYARHTYDDKGNLAIHVDRLDLALLSERSKVLQIASACLPHTHETVSLDLSQNPEDAYRRFLKRQTQSNMVPDAYRDALEASLKLVSLTGLLPYAGDSAPSTTAETVVL